MKTKELTIIYFFLFQSFALLGQNYKSISFGDTTYMNQVFSISLSLGVSIDSSWKLKEKLPKGNYLVIKESQCGIDTLIKAQFSKDGSKDGKWIFWNSRECFIEQEINTDKIINMSWSEDKSKEHEIHYENNFITLHKSYHRGTNITHSELMYGDSTKTVNEWLNKKIYSSKGLLRNEINLNKLSSDFYVEKIEYFENGNIDNRIKFWLLENINEDWVYYYKDGTIKAKGPFTQYAESMSISQLKFAENGTWKYYNQKGLLVAEVDYNLGKVISYKKFLNEEISMPGVEKLINE